MWAEAAGCNAKLSWSYAKAHLPGCYQELNYSIKLLPLRLSPALSSLPLLPPFSTPSCSWSLLRLCLSHSFSTFISCCSLLHFLALAGFACHHCEKRPTKCFFIVPDIHCATENNKGSTAVSIVHLTFLILFAY